MFIFIASIILIIGLRLLCFASGIANRFGRVVALSTISLLLVFAGTELGLAIGRDVTRADFDNGPRRSLHFTFLGIEKDLEEGRLDLAKQKIKTLNQGWNQTSVFTDEHDLSRESLEALLMKIDKMPSSEADKQ